ncbi:hypothetical protein ACW0JT_00290 [Arthrobacter sp. SA17]
MTNSEKATRSTVEELLLDAGHADSPELKTYLLNLLSLADLPLPAPGAELASMLAGSVDEPARIRPLRKHRPAVVSVAVIAGMGLGVSGVAATSPNPGFRQGLVSIQNFDGGWAPALAAPLGGASVPLSAAPTSPNQSLQGRSLAEPDSGPDAAEGAADAPRDGARVAAGLAGVKISPRSGRHAASARFEETGNGDKGWGSVAALSGAAVQGLDKVARKSTGSAPGRLPSGRHFSQTAPPQSVASVADSVGTWLKKNHG